MTGYGPVQWGWIKAVSETYDFEGRRKEGSNFLLLNQTRAINWDS
jgi:hypothetical protein